MPVSCPWAFISRSASCPYPQAALDSDFTFTFPDIDGALQTIVGDRKDVVDGKALPSREPRACHWASSRDPA